MNRTVETSLNRYPWSAGFSTAEACQTPALFQDIIGKTTPAEAAV